MKKILLALGITTVLFSACTSTDENLRELELTQREPEYILEEVETPKKSLEELIVFNEEGVIIKREGNNLILSMPIAILFDFDAYVVKNSVKTNLNTLAKALRENKDIKLKIDGHTDYIGSDQYNLNLSLKRANSIKEYLVSEGVNPNNITIEGYGKQNPVADNSTNSGRAQNRRVEFIISRDSVKF